MSPLGNIGNNLRLAITFLMGLAMMALGAVGLKWVVGGVEMALLTAVAIELGGAGIILLAWRDLDRQRVKAFFALIGVKFVDKLTHFHKPIPDALLQKLLNNPRALTSPEREELIAWMHERKDDQNEEVDDLERRIAAIMPEMIAIALELELQPQAEK